MSMGSAPLPRPGDTVGGKYVLERLLGQGGMGAVFAARHIKLSKAVAIKIMLADASNPEASQRFLNEGRAAANIQNEHVVRVDDVDEELGYAYMVLELLDGEDLAQLLERTPAKRLPPHVAVGYVLQALKGVTQAHAIGIVHRDLKPSNLFLAKRKDGSVVVKVLDFGISKAQGSSALAASPNALTSTKAMLGSPLYMSPEQLRSSKSVDHRADIWAIGVILYELMTGHLPFMGDNLGELFAAILETDPTPVRARAPEVSPGLAEVIRRCLARKADDRFQSATELMHALMPFAAPQSSPSLGGTAVIGPGSAPATLASGHGGAHATTPSAFTPNTPNPSMRPPLASVPSASAPRLAGSSPGFGAVTPQGMVSTGGGGWQNTASGSIALPEANVPLIFAGVTALLLVIGGILGVLALRSRSTPDHLAVDPSAAATSAPAPSSTTLPSALETATAVAAAAQAPETAPSVAQAAPAAPETTTSPTPAKTVTTHKAKPPKSADPPKVEPTAPKATATTTATSRLQNAR